MDSQEIDEEYSVSSMDREVSNCSENSQGTGHVSWVMWAQLGQRTQEGKAICGDRGVRSRNMKYLVR